MTKRRSIAGATALIALLAGCSHSGDKATLDLSAALPGQVPTGTVLRIGDPAIQADLQASGLDKELTDAGVRVDWANISGGPQTIQAFRGDKLDCGSVADIPSLFAAWARASPQIILQAGTPHTRHSP